MMKSRISASLVTFEPGVTSLITNGFMACVSKNERARLKACTATPRSVGCESWFGLTVGRSRVELDVMLTQPLDNGETGTVTMVPYRLLGSVFATRAAAVISNLGVDG